MARLIVLAALIFIVVLALRAFRRWQNEHAFAWRPRDIDARVLRGGEGAGSGQVLALEQKLLPGEGGWSRMSLALPGRWEVAGIAHVEDGLILRLQDGRQFYLHRRNVRQLAHALRDSPHVADGELERLWDMHARIEAA